MGLFVHESFHGDRFSNVNDFGLNLEILTEFWRELIGKEIPEKKKEDTECVMCVLRGLLL